MLVFQEPMLGDGATPAAQPHPLRARGAVDLAETRFATTVAAGGRLLDESEDRWRVADPEGNEMVIVSGA